MAGPRRGRQSGAGPAGHLRLAADWHLLKVVASETVVSCVLDALRIYGVAGYVERSQHSLSRVLRDALLAPIMMSNDRMLSLSGVPQLPGSPGDVG